ncbi:hypothetical protein HDV02_006182 [Globomyces sp. JEL0801]|nr:hypothetical protein HDV02_006182 [Globomyces sp. JEL0801]
MLIDYGFPKESFVPIPVDQNGIQVDELETKLKSFSNSNNNIKQSSHFKKFKFLLYLVPTFSNPTGTILSHERRERIVKLAREYDVLVVCDDVYELLPFSSIQNQPDRLLAYDLATIETGFGNVISNCSFSKLLAPGIRLGWIESSDSMINQIKSAAVFYSGGCPNHFMSTAILSAIENNSLDLHLNHLLSTYENRAKVMCNELTKVLPKGFHFIPPNGGFFVWIYCDIRKGLTTTTIMDALNDKESIVGLKKERVSFTPGNAFSSDMTHGNWIRLSFAMYQDDQIVEGIRRLGIVFQSVTNEANL